ncbi:hypothetical protein [Streptomyces sp. NPDC056337]|uniref:hypothetical protein n=1 Tax=Streptomyces sp. NPDC056337 TaxID=3345787 RepID=UPI0035DC16D0
MRSTVQPAPRPGGARQHFARRFRAAAAAVARRLTTAVAALPESQTTAVDAPVDARMMRVDAPQVSHCAALGGQCLGEDCDGPGGHTHSTAETALHVSFADEPLMPFNLAQFGSEQPELAFFADGSWPTLNLAQVDELLSALDQYTSTLRNARQQLAKAQAASARRFDEQLAAVLAGGGQ